MRNDAASTIAPMPRPSVVSTLRPVQRWGAVIFIVGLALLGLTAISFTASTYPEASSQCLIDGPDVPTEMSVPLALISEMPQVTSARYTYLPLGLECTWSSAMGEQSATVSSLQEWTVSTVNWSTLLIGALALGTVVGGSWLLVMGSARIPADSPTRLRDGRWQEF